MAEYAAFFGFAACGAAGLILLVVGYQVLLPFVLRWRVRHAIEYRAIASLLNRKWPGAPGCICWPGDDRDPRCMGGRHRSKKPKS